MIAVEKARGVTTQVRFLPAMLTSLGSKSRTLFYLNHRNRVNTILTLGDEFAFARGYGARSGCDVPTLDEPWHGIRSSTQPNYLTPVTDHQKFSVG
jgi:hypothetical protein